MAKLNDIIDKGKPDLERVLVRIESLQKKIEELTNKLALANEEILTSKEVCKMLEVSRNHLTHLDGLNITEPLYLEEGSKKKYYLRSQILKIFMDKTYKKRY